MQDRYTGDIGDFGKYSLLRNLTRDDLCLGVIWYLNGKQEKNADGRFVQYLCPFRAIRCCITYERCVAARHWINMNFSR